MLAMPRASQKAFRIGPGIARDSAPSDSRRAARSGLCVMPLVRSSNANAASRARLASPASRRAGLARKNAKVSTPTRRGRASRTRGARRIVCGGPARTPDVCYYTQDHYQSFARIRP